MSSENEGGTALSYVYHTHSTVIGGGPMFTLLYIQCIMFILNAWLNMNMEMWQLVFPSFIVIVVMVAGQFNRG